MLCRKWTHDKALAFLDTLAKLQQATFGFIMSVPFHWTDFHEMLCPRVFRTYFERIQILTKITGSFHEDLCTFVILSGAFVFRMRNVSDKSCRENRNIHFMFSNSCTKVPSVWYGTARQATDDNITWRMSFACWITKVTDTLRICNAYCFSTAAAVTRFAPVLCLCVSCLAYWTLLPVGYE